MLPRKRNSHRRFRYSLDYKKKVLQSIRSIGVSKTLRKMDVKKEQVHYWLQKEQEILSTPNEECTGRYRLSKTVYGEVAQEELQLYQWIMERKRHGEYTRNDEILERATTMFYGIPNNKTKASRRWLFSFKKRFGLSRREPKPKPPQPDQQPGDEYEEGDAVVKEGEGEPMQEVIDLEDYEEEEEVEEWAEL